MSFWSLKRKSSFFFLLLLSLSFSSCSADTKESLFSVRPVNVYEAGAWFLFSEEPGSSLEDEFLVINTSDQDLTFVLAAVDSTTTDTGDFALLGKDSEKNQFLNEWIDLEIDKITLSPGEVSTVSFELTVPESAEQREYSGGILVHLSPSENANFDSGEMIDFAYQIGMRVYLTVTDEPEEIFKEYRPYVPVSYSKYWLMIGAVLMLSVFSIIYILYFHTEE